MRAWIYLLSAGVLLTTGQTGLAQRANQQQQGREAQGGGGGGGTGEAGMDGFGTGASIDQNLSDPDAVFDIDRGNAVGASAENVRGFSTIGGAGNAGAMPGGAGGAFGGGFGGGLGALGGLFGGGNGFGRTQEQDTSKRIRTRLRSGISVPSPPAPQVQARIQTRLAELPAEPRFRNVDVVMRGRTAVLNGQVENGGDRRMAELLIRLEPGVSKIENQLLIAGEGIEDAPTPLEVPAPPAEPLSGASVE